METTLERAFTDSEGFSDVPRIFLKTTPFNRLRNRLCGTSLKLEDFFPGYNADVDRIRKRDYQRILESDRIYLDSTATSQVPESVIRKIFEFRMNYLRGSNHSKNSKEARRADEEWHKFKDALRSFFHANNYHIAATPGTTGSSLLIASNFKWRPGDLFMPSESEHNSQYASAVEFARKAGAKVDFARINLEDGRIDLDYVVNAVRAHQGRSIVSIVDASNLTGVITGIEKIRKALPNSIISLDMAQSGGHIPRNLDELGVEFAATSAHKMYGPTGIGALFVRKDAVDLLDFPRAGGSVFLSGKSGAVPLEAPGCWEPGTQHLEGGIEWRYALEFITKFGMDKIHAHDNALGAYFLREIQKIPNVRVYGPKDFERGDRTAVVTFSIDNLFNHDYVAQELDRRGISVRNGCFCAHILGSKLAGVEVYDKLEEMITDINLGKRDKSEVILPGAVRASFAFYNTIKEANYTVQAVREIASQFSR